MDSQYGDALLSCEGGTVDSQHEDAALSGGGEVDSQPRDALSRGGVTVDSQPSDASF